MNKREFLETISARVAGLPAEEQTRLMEYFSELIDDRVELGMDEAAAVAALGDPEALLRDIAPAALPAVQERDARGSGDDWSEAIREIHIHLRNGDGTIRRGALPGGMTAQISASSGNRFTWRLEDGVLTIAEAEQARRGIIFQRGADLTLTLSDFEAECLIADSYGGNIEVVGVATALRTVLASSTGDIQLTDCGCHGRMEITTRSGDIALTGIDAEADCKLETLSGDIELNRVNAGRLRGRTASGDVDGRGLRAGALAFGTTSGDIELEDAAAESTMLCETASGDIDLMDADGADVRLSTASGDVTLRLLGRPEGYDVQASSRSGEIEIRGSVPNGAPVRVQTGSGDIEVKAL